MSNFRTRKNFKWIEKKLESPVKDFWGRLAAISHPTWFRLNNWIEMGRPFSLAALDTLTNLISYKYNPLIDSIKPRPVLEDITSIEEMSKVLKDYYEKDKVPRVKKRVESILNNWNLIIGE